MKRKTLTTAVLAGLTGMAGMVSVSNAVHLNPDGLGQVLLYPYYSAKGGNDTLISVVNTTDNAKSVKIRFIEALNSREVLDFNIYMSAFDVWTAAITENDATGGGKIIISDNTCTAPNFKAGEGFGTGDFLDGDGNAHIAFRNFQYTAGNADGGPESGDAPDWAGGSRGASGYIELIEMGTLVGASAGHATHTAAGVPANCGQLNANWVGGGMWVSDPAADHEAPSGGVFGNASILNVAEGVMFSYAAEALDAFSTTILHTNPGLVIPDLNSGTEVSNVFLPGQQLVDTQTWSRGIDAVNATMMHSKLMNEYVVGGGAAGLSEWVVTFPTKRFYADAAPGGPGEAAPGAAIPPFTDTWTVASPGACENVNFGLWDREEGSPGVGGLIPSPPPPQPVGFQLCREANVVRITNTDGVPDMAEITKEPFRTDFLGYVNFQVPNNFLAGWARYDFDLNPANVTEPAASGDRYVGLPAIGFWVNTFLNNTLTDDDGVDVLANYGGTFRHRGDRRVLPAS